MRRAGVLGALVAVAVALEAGPVGEVRAQGGPAAGGDVVVSELLAANRGVTRDGDGDSSDWFELYNRGSEPVDLKGWGATDHMDPAPEEVWTFPAVALSPGGYRVIYASGKDRRDPAGELHTHFRLDAEGEYLAILRPDGTVEHAWAPAFPPQAPDVSYGLGQDVETVEIVPDAAPLLWLVPEGDAGTAWRGGEEPYDDGAWEDGRSGVGWVAAVPGFAVRNVLASGSVTDLAVAEAVLADPALQREVHTETAPFIDYLGTNAPGHYPADRPFPGAEPGEDVDHFAVEATGAVAFPEAGPWTIGVTSDDGFGLEVTGAGVDFRIEHPAPRGPGDTSGTLEVPAPGEYALRLVVYERAGGSGAELWAAPGERDAWSPEFRRIGDTEAGGLAVRSTAGPSGDLAAFAGVLRTDIEAAARGRSASVLLRYPFDLASPGSFEDLVLRVRYDDGFVAWLNGVEVARRNAPATLGPDAVAPEDRPAARASEAEVVHLAGAEGLLQSGRNILAVRALNDAPDGEDLLLHAELADVAVQSREPRWFPEPTPGAPNAEGRAGVVGDTSFSVDRGFYEEGFEVEVRTATADATIRYTLDGSEPGPDRGRVYTGPVAVDGTTTLRAAAYRTGWVGSNVDTQTYIFLDDTVRQDRASVLESGFPPSWGAAAADYAMDPDVVGAAGRDLYGGKYSAVIRDALLAVPTLAISAEVDSVFGPEGIYTHSTRRGEAWERPCAAELILPGGGEGFEVRCGLRVQGGAFRSHSLTKKHSLRLLFKGRWGPTKLRYPLFGPDAAQEFDTLTLRANSNDGWQWDDAGSKPLYLRDSFARETALDGGLPASHEVFVHLYLNGVYWGLYDVVERPDAQFSASYLGGEKEDWDAVNHGGVTEGDAVAWREMLELDAGDVASAAGYRAVQGLLPGGGDDPSRGALVDVDSLIDYMIVNLYGGNRDWPHKNFWAGRRRGSGSEGFQFYMWDAEWTLGLRSGVTADRTGVDQGIAAPYAALRANPEFRLRFGDRAERWFGEGGPLHVDRARPGWDPEHPERNRPAARLVRLAGEIELALVAESARWGDQHEATPYTRDEHWMPERDRLLSDYFPRRSEVVLGQLRAAGLYPSIDPPVVRPSGGEVAPGTRVDLAAPAGTVWYTVDGTDPRLAGGEVAPGALRGGTAEEIPLVEQGSPVRWTVPGPGDAGTVWTGIDYDDTGWSEGTTGIGYERGTGYEAHIATDVEAAMYERATSVRVRLPFEVSEPEQFAFLVLRVRYDDGFIAWINGERVASRNAPGGDPAADAAAEAGRADSLAVVFEPIDVSAALDLLHPGRNILALQGLNVDAGSSDLLLLPELAGATSGGTQVEITGTTRLRARSRRGEEWSALRDVLYVVDGPSDLRVTEMLYHPVDSLAPDSPYDAEEFEWLELRNTGEDALSLEGVRIEGAVEFDFAAAAVGRLFPGERLVVVRNPDAFAERYDPAGRLVAGTWRGHLDNGGERLVVRGPLGVVQEFTWSDDWYPGTDGGGFSLVVRDDGLPAEDWSLAGTWRPSAVPGGTPGRPEEVEPEPAGRRRPGDANSDAAVDVSDAIAVLQLLFGGDDATLPCAGALQEGGNLRVFDATGDGRVDVSDPVRLLGWLFQGGPPHAGGTECVPVAGCTETCR